MATIEGQCLHTSADSVVASAANGNMEDARRHLAAMLRCSSSLSCAEAVSCSDDTMALLRRVLGPR